MSKKLQLARYSTKYKVYDKARNLIGNSDGYITRDEAIGAVTAMKDYDVVDVKIEPYIVGGIEQISSSLKQFTLVLSTRDHTHLGQLRNIQDLKYTANYNSADEISFKIVKELDGEVDRLWDDVYDLRFIYVVDIDEYFEISVSLIDHDNKEKTITAKSACEAELSQTNLYIEINNTNDQYWNYNEQTYIPTIFYDESDKQHSLLHRILETVPSYTIDYVDESLCDLQRTFSVTGTSIYDFMVGDLAKQMNCVFTFDSVNRTISAYDMYTVCNNIENDDPSKDCPYYINEGNQYYGGNKEQHHRYRGKFNDFCPYCGDNKLKYPGRDTNVFVSTKNLTEEVTFDTDTDSIKNCFKLVGGDENMTSAIKMLSPGKTSRIYHFSSEQKNDMSRRLVHKIDLYEKLYTVFNSNKPMSFMYYIYVKYDGKRYNYVYENGKYIYKEETGGNYVHDEATDMYFKIDDFNTFYTYDEDKDEYSLNYEHEYDTVDRHYQTDNTGLDYKGDYDPTDPSVITSSNYTAFKEANENDYFYTKDNGNYLKATVFVNNAISIGENHNSTIFVDVPTSFIQIDEDGLPINQGEAYVSEKNIVDCYNDLIGYNIEILRDDKIEVTNYRDMYTAYYTKKFATETELAKQVTKTIERIENPIIGHNKLVKYMYDAEDFILYLRSAMMPVLDKVDGSAYAQGKKIQEAFAKGIEIGVASLGNWASTSKITRATAESAIKNHAKIFTNSGYVKIETLNGALNESVWTGIFKVTSYADKEDIRFVGLNDISMTNEGLTPFTVELTHNYSKYVSQRVMQELITFDEDECVVSDVLSLNKSLYSFKYALKEYSLNRLESFKNGCQAVIDILTEAGASSYDNKQYPDDDPMIGTQTMLNDMYHRYYKSPDGTKDTDIFSFYEKLRAVEAEYNLRSKEIQIVYGVDIQDGDQVKNEKGLKSVLRIANDKIIALLDMDRQLGDDKKSFNNYIREQEYTNSNYTSEDLSNSELLDYARRFIVEANKELIQSSTYQHSITSNLYNLMKMEEFFPLLDDFELGNFIRVKCDDKIYRLRLISYEIDFNNITNINTTFSDMTRTADGLNDIESILNTAQNMSTSYGYTQSQADKGNSASIKLGNIVRNGLNSGLMNIMNNTKEEIVIDGNGLAAKTWDDVQGIYNPKQLRITHNIMCFTENNWESASLALGEHNYIRYDEDNKKFVGDVGYGLTSKFVQSGYIIGESQIIGSKIYSVDYNKTGKKEGTYIDLTGNGYVWFGGGNLEVDRAGNVKVKGDVTAKSFTLSKNDSNDFYTDSNGKIVIEKGKNFGLDANGNLHAENGYFDGEINATSGTFNGNVIAQSFQTVNGPEFNVDKDGKVTISKSTTSGGFFNINKDGTIKLKQEGTKNGVKVSCGIDEFGQLVATNGVFMGSVTATSFSIGGVSSDKDGNLIIKQGKFGLAADGKLTASDGDFTGKIHATEAVIDDILYMKLKANTIAVDVLSLASNAYGTDRDLLIGNGLSSKKTPGISLMSKTTFYQSGIFRDKTYLKMENNSNEYFQNSIQFEGNTTTFDNYITFTVDKNNLEASLNNIINRVSTAKEVKNGKEISPTQRIRFYHILKKQDYKIKNYDEVNSIIEAGLASTDKSIRMLAAHAYSEFKEFSEFYETQGTNTTVGNIKISAFSNGKLNANSKMPGINSGGSEITSDDELVGTLFSIADEQNDRNILTYKRVQNDGSDTSHPKSKYDYKYTVEILGTLVSTYWTEIK